MNLEPSNQLDLFGHEDVLNSLNTLYSNNNLPNKILLTGQKGIGKCTLAYHLINFILSSDEDFSYDLFNCKIIPDNKSFKLVQNKSNPNFILIDIYFLDENYAVIPPSTGIAIPLTNDASSDNKKSAALATSSGCPGLPIGPAPPRFFTSSSLSNPLVDC